MKSETIKKVSIVMCTYNGEKYIREQLDTLLHQTYPIHEIIIQDDHSTDGTMPILQSYEENYPFIKTFRNEGEKGINPNFLSAILRATGDYIAISDQDDLWELDKIEKQIDFIKDKLLCAGVTRPFSNEDGVFIHEDNRIPNVSLERTIHVPMVAGHTMLFRKELIDNIPRLDYWIKYFIYDHLLQITAASYNSFVFCPFVLVNQRRLLSSATYMQPLNYKENVWNIFPTIQRTFRNYRLLRPQMKLYFARIYALLDEIKSFSPEKENAILLAKYQSSNNFLDYIKLSFLCVKLRDRIFHAKGKNNMLSVLRAFYFPISCSDYFRYMNKSSV